MSTDNLINQIDEVLGTHDHNMNRTRPYTGQSHTILGIRGATEIRGITFRDLRDCFVRAILLSTGGSLYPDPSKQPKMDILFQEALKGEMAVLCADDVYGFNLDLLDPMAICQNLACEVEQAMGIFPNIEGKAPSSDPEVARLRAIISEVHSWIVCAAIATPEDMMQNAEYITEITSPDYRGNGDVQ